MKLHKLHCCNNRSMHDRITDLFLMNQDIVFILLTFCIWIRFWPLVATVEKNCYQLENGDSRNQLCVFQNSVIRICRRKFQYSETVKQNCDDMKFKDNSSILSFFSRKSTSTPEWLENNTPISNQLRLPNVANRNWTLCRWRAGNHGCVGRLLCWD